MLIENLSIIFLKIIFTLQEPCITHTENTLYELNFECESQLGTSSINQENK